MNSRNNTSREACAADLKRRKNDGAVDRLGKLTQQRTGDDPESTKPAAHPPKSEYLAVPETVPLLLCPQKAVEGP